jgi:hypothetical protein
VTASCHGTQMASRCQRHRQANALGTTRQHPQSVDGMGPACRAVAARTAATLSSLVDKVGGSVFIEMSAPGSCLAQLPCDDL